MVILKNYLRPKILKKAKKKLIIKLNFTIKIEKIFFLKFFLPKRSILLYSQTLLSTMF